jgi:single-strand DNA-binding protein
MYQQITLVGNLGNDPEMRYTPTGVPVANFRMAVNKTMTTQDGQRHDKTMWFRVTVWRKQAEIVSQYLTKGSKVLVSGELDEARPYTDREGNLAVSLEVTAQTVRFIGGRGDGATHESAGFQSAPPAGGGDSHAVSDEEIPF